MTDTVKLLKIEPLRAFQDNYIWLLTRADSNKACVVDPGDAAPVVAALLERGLQLDSILLTHHHADHTGGVAELLSFCSPQVYGPAGSRIQGISTPVQQGSQLKVLGCTFDVLEVPGHTLDHIAYFAPEQTDAGVPTPLLFCGDTLFAAGCGRLFEGTAEQMYTSLKKLAKLPANTLVYCAHEYTLANIRFAEAAEPDNFAVKERRKTDTRRLETDQITLPSTIELELRTNPFLRCHIEGLQYNAAPYLTAEHPNEIAVFAAVRRWKDGFR
jgi:hydroxyacylglutathione hydrolase